MKEAKCVKCDSSGIYKHEGLFYRGNLGISFWSSTRVTDYVCTSCGYIESYVEDKKKLEKIRNEWQKV